MAATIFDADSHVMEVEDWLPSFADPSVREQLAPLGLAKAGKGAAELMDRLPGVWEKHKDQDIESNILEGPKGWLAPGALDTEVRSRVLDTLGISAQLVFPTFSLGHFAGSRDMDVLYGGTRAINRAMAAFCEPDPRLLPVGYLPLHDADRALVELDLAAEAGVKAIWMPSEAPGRSPAHVDYDPIWERLGELGIPFVLHVGGGATLPKEFHDNGRPRPTDWLGGGENLRAKDLPVLHHSPERFLACLVLDGVFERHPDLRGGAIELGAMWVPAMLRTLDNAAKTLGKHEPLIKELPLAPSEYIRRQVKFTPFPFEDTAWLVEQCGPELFLFSTDYPHPEGGRHPFENFGSAMSGFDEGTRERFFWRNGAELFGLV